MDLSDYTLEELAEMFDNKKIEADNLKEQLYQLNREIAERLADREPLHGNTYQIGTRLFKRSRQRNKTIWDVDHLRSDLYRRAIEGRDYISPDGELMMEPEQRVYDLLCKVFTLTPKVTPLKERNIDVDEYREVEYGESYQIQQI